MASDRPDRNRIRHRPHPGKSSCLPRPRCNQRLFPFSGEHGRSCSGCCAGMLIVSVILHVIAAYQLTMQNRAARPVGYAQSRAAGEHVGVAHDAMGRSSAAHFHRAAHHAFHDRLETRRADFVESRRLHEHRDELPDLVDHAFLRCRDDRAWASSLSRSMELGPLDRCRAATRATVAPTVAAAVARCRSGSVSPRFPSRSSSD